MKFFVKNGDSGKRLKIPEYASNACKTECLFAIIKYKCEKGNVMCKDISSGWKYVEYATNNDETGIPDDAADIDLPADILRRKNRNYTSAMGEYCGYYDGTAVTFYKQLPRLDKHEWIVLEIEGVSGYADVYINGVSAAHIEGGGKHFVDITERYVFGGKNIVKICVWAPQMAGRYTGAGISGGVRIHTHVDSVALRDDGVYAVSSIDGAKAVVSVHAEICDKTGEASVARKKLTLEAVLKNAHGRRASGKTKKIKLKNVYINSCEINFRLSRFYTWSVTDPYLYTVELTLRDENGKVLDTAVSTLGIVGRALTPLRGLVLNGRGVKLKGAVVLPDNGILGMESTPSAEEYKLSKIKDIGYNAVRYKSCPTEAALDTLDKLGLMAQVDLFEVWAQGAFPCDGHVSFNDSCIYDCERIVCQLRKHPSVVMYGLCGDAPETYERGQGSEIAKMLSDRVRELDSSRPITVNAKERVPLREELENAGLKASKATDAMTAIGMGREKDLFGTLTQKSFAQADVAGYCYLYPRYASDRDDFPDRLIVGSESYPARAFDAFEECDRNPNVIGEFLYCAADYTGYPLGKPEYENEQSKLLPPHTSYCGDLDFIYNDKPAAYYRRIMFGDKSVSCITVSDPESSQMRTNSGYTLKETHKVWNWPHSLGKPIEIEVYSGGEVVALYRDGKLVGRKLAGKVNKHTATFKTDYYPGILEAVSYHKGRECSRTTLESVTAPRAVKLTCNKKARGEGELLFVEIAVTDKEGRVVPYASREVEIAVSGQGELYALGSADPESQIKSGESTVCPVYDGKALAVIKTLSDGDGKIIVKATSDGLLSGKISLRVK